jgi:hypothetical protein
LYQPRCDGIVVQQAGMLKPADQLSDRGRHRLDHLIGQEICENISIGDETLKALRRLRVRNLELGPQTTTKAFVMRCWYWTLDTGAFFRHLEARRLS